jgi:DNA-binding ferritin-like protein
MDSGGEIIMELIHLATLFRIINLYSHHAHNLTFGCTFMQDHEFFAELYDFADGVYDDCIEREIGTASENIDLCQILKDSYDLIEQLDDNYFENILKLLDEAINFIEESCKDGKLSQGTINMLVGHADKIEVLQYKIKRRLK